MKEISRQRNDYAILKSIRDYLTLEELSEFIRCIEKDSKKFIERLIIEFTPVKRPDLVIITNDDNDLCNLNVKDFINYSYTKGEDPIEKLIEVYKLLTKDFILPTAGFITNNFKSISFEQIPEHPIARISFSENRNVTIKAKNNVIELIL